MRPTRGLERAYARSYIWRHVYFWEREGMCARSLRKLPDFVPAVVVVVVCVFVGAHWRRRYVRSVPIGSAYAILVGQRQPAGNWQMHQLQTTIPPPSLSLSLWACLVLAACAPMPIISCNRWHSLSGPFALPSGSTPLCSSPYLSEGAPFSLPRASLFKCPYDDTMPT